MKVSIAERMKFTRGGIRRRVGGTVPSGTTTFRTTITKSGELGIISVSDEHSIYSSKVGLTKANLLVI